MKTILCVTDSSAGSVSAVNYLIELVQLMDARVILFHNLLQTERAASHLQLMDDLEERNEYISLMETLKKQLEVLNAKASIRFDVELRHGQPQVTIPAIVQKEQVDLVVFNNEPSGKPAANLAAEIKALAGCPVLVVPPLIAPNTTFAAALQQELLTA